MVSSEAVTTRSPASTSTQPGDLMAVTWPTIPGHIRAHRRRHQGLRARHRLRLPRPRPTGGTVVEAPSLDADRDESSGEPAESATQLHNGGKTERMGAAGRPAPCGQPACNRVEDVYCLLPGSHDIVTGR